MQKTQNPELVPLLPISSIEVRCSECGLTASLADIVNDKVRFHNADGRMVTFHKQMLNADERLELDRMELYCELRQWHNLKTQIKDEGEKANASGGVLNPALLTISPKE